MEDCSTHITERKVLFQGGCPWPGNWQTTHSRVVRGVSYSRLDSYLSLSEFHGWLDRRSIDSAGFAAIHTMGQDHRWDLSQYDAIEVTMSRSDDKVYTLTLEDERPIAWEGTFRPGTSGRTTSRVIRLGRLKPRKGDPYLRPLNLGDIRGFGIWIGNSSSAQEGGFSLILLAISVVKLPCSCAPRLDLIGDGRLSNKESLRIRTQVAMRTVWDAFTEYILTLKLKRAGS